ncbi:MAG TPA: hypothetical protein VHI78_03595 [Bacteroidales bacterium]|jgi:hypothetical protein|nr:hypothetical protein [Bacteroidales bacterium]
MTKTLFRILILPLAVLLNSTCLLSQTARSERQDNLQQQKVAFFNEKLQLTAEESSKFWPVYNDFQNRRDKITRDRNTLLQYFEANQVNMTEDEAKIMIAKYVGFQKEETLLLETYTEKFMLILPAKKVIRIYLVELEFKKWLLENLRQNKAQVPKN